VEYVFEHRKLMEYGAVVTFGAREVVITEHSTRIVTYASDVYEYRRDDGYTVVIDVPPGSIASLGRWFGLLGADGEAVPVWFGREATITQGTSEDIVRAFQACGWEVDVRENKGLIPRLMRRLGIDRP
jgi:hypothetical protein